MNRQITKCMFALILLTGLLSTTLVSTVEAQEPAEVPAEMAVLKHEVGKWDAAIKFWLPGGGDEPTESEGVETCTMVGEHWLVSHFSYEAFGQKFGGHGVFGFDSEKGHYVGTWYSSDSPNAIPMIGKYDEESKTITYEMDGLDGMGNPMKGKVMTTYVDDDQKNFEMHIDMGEGTLHKMMEVKYTRK